MDDLNGPGDGPATCPSLLQRGAAAGTAPHRAGPPGYLADLNLDAVVAAIVGDRDGHDLRPVFHTPLRDPDDVHYRHEVFRDLRNAEVLGPIEAFSEAMRRLREHTARAASIRNPRQVWRLHLDGVVAYCTAVAELEAALARAAARGRLASRALLSVTAYLGAYGASPGFNSLCDAATGLRAALDDVRYGLTFLEDRIHVRHTGPRGDYGERLERTFERFRRSEPAERVAEPDRRVGLTFVEAAILELVARLHPDVFARLEAFTGRHAHYLDDAVVGLDRDLQFYLAYVAYLRRFEPLGLEFCYPEVSARNGAIRARDAFDVALAQSLGSEAHTIVRNDVDVDASERMLVVTGANQGGKTTFARMFGQLHYLAALGLPVPGREARLLLFDDILTHFEREERLGTLQGKLQEELTRLRGVLERATERSVVILNEPFASTASGDALYLGRSTLERLLEAGATGVYVTFVDELSTLDPRIASLTATVDPRDPVRRTFKIVRRAADGRAHALAMARAYGLTYEALRRRLGGGA